MIALGISGLVNVVGFLNEQFPQHMSRGSRIIQGMDSAAALIQDGTIIAAVAQERFDRVKKSGAFPFAAIDYCLQTAGLQFAELDAVCGNFNFARYLPLYQSEIGQAYYQRCLSPTTIQNHLAGHYGSVPNYMPIDHHLAHLHAALISAPFDNALAVVMDAAGEIGSTSVYRVEPHNIQRLKRYPISKSLGIFYSLITQFLGFAFNEDEYKVMGLASLGDPSRYTEFFASAIRLHDHADITIPCLELKTDFADGLFFNSSMRAIEHGLGFPGATASLQQKADVSAALQARFTDAVFHICAYYEGNKNLLWSGGCAENCMTAGALHDRFDKVHIAYASGDDGTALGAVAAHSFAMEQPIRYVDQMPFFGPAPDLDTVKLLAAQHQLDLTPYLSEQAMLMQAAIDLANDKIVALCNGRMEYGARALGNRSLLALPSNGANKERINQAIKKRENYRPFAPAVTIETAHEYFELCPDEAYPYMTMLTRVRPDYIDRLPAIVHVDGTARVQTVDQRYNPSFHQLLSFLDSLTGMPVVLNTSYNVNHQPIVCSEAEAIDTFLAMEIDALYIANSRISR